MGYNGPRWLLPRGGQLVNVQNIVGWPQSLAFIYFFSFIPIPYIVECLIMMLFLFLGGFKI